MDYIICIAINVRRDLQIDTPYTWSLQCVDSCQNVLILLWNSGKLKLNLLYNTCWQWWLTPIKNMVIWNTNIDPGSHT